MPRHSSLVGLLVAVGAGSLAVSSCGSGTDTNAGAGPGGSNGSSSSSSSGAGGTGSSSSGQGGQGGAFCITADEVVCDGAIAHACSKPASTGTDCSKTGTICVQDLGCAVCKPGSGTCTASGATYCKKDGSGYLDFTCDAELGLTCQGDACVGACAPSVIEDSYLGCEYFPTTTINDVNDSYPFEVAVANASPDPAHVTVTGGALASAVKVTVAPGGVERVPLPWVVAVKVCTESSLGNGFDQINACSAAHNPDYGSRVVKSGAYRLASDRPVAVYQFAPIQAAKGGFQAGTTEAGLLLPQTVYGERYRVATYGQGFARGAIAITATVDGTMVKVTPTAALTAGGGNASGVAAGQTGIYMANRGDVVEVISAANDAATDVGDLTGTLVEADHPIQVLGAHGCAWVVNQQSCDHIEDTMLPDGTLGTDYVVKAATYPGSIAYLVRIIAAEDAVKVTFDPPSVSPPVTLAKAGDIFDLSGPDVAVHVTSTGRVLVAGLNEGDNTLAIFPPTEHFRTSYLFYAPDFQHNYVKILGSPGLLLDGVKVDPAAFTVIGASSYGWAILPVTSGPHTIGNPTPVGEDPPSPKAFGLMVFGNQDANYVPGGLPSAYEYPGGLDVHQSTTSVPK